MLANFSRSMFKLWNMSRLKINKRQYSMRKARLKYTKMYFTDSQAICWVECSQKAKTWFAFLRPVFIVSIVIYFRAREREVFFVGGKLKHIKINETRSPPIVAYLGSQTRRPWSHSNNTNKRRIKSVCVCRYDNYLFSNLVVMQEMYDDEIYQREPPHKNTKYTHAVSHWEYFKSVWLA